MERTCSRGKPRLAAVASPSESPSSAELSSQANIRHSIQTTTITTHALQPTNPVLPSMNACMACMISGASIMISELIAPSTTPTITPASNRRKVCCTPRASSSVSSTAATAPAKAAPVRPRRTNHCAANGDTPNKTSASATPSEAPEALPSR